MGISEYDIFHSKWGINVAEEMKVANHLILKWEITLHCKGGGVTLSEEREAEESQSE